MPVLLPVHVREELEQLAARASVVLNEHGNDHDLCAICGCAWPCEYAVLADHNLELI